VNTKRRFGLVLLLTLLGVSAYGGEATIKLTSDARTALVQLRCSTCHSLDYVAMNSPFLVRAGWEAEVRKMIKVMGAPIPDNDVAPIVDYLTQYYGPR
jgi:hypothetical protein